MDIKIRIFLFHRISPHRDVLWNPMTPKLFEKILIYLNKKYEIVPLEKALLGEYKPISKKKLCALTFDDGYKDFIDYAFPILQKHKSPSSMYIVSDCIENNVPPWTYILNHLFIHTSHLSLRINSKVLPLVLQQTKWKNKKDRLKYLKKLSPFLKQLNNQERILIFEQIVSEFNDVDKPDGLMLNWDEIRYIYENGCEIGSHSTSHPLLAKKTDISHITKELAESGKKIETAIGKFPTAISYPFGSYNDIIKNIAYSVGYKIGLTVNSHSYNSKKKYLFEIPRIELYSEPFFKSTLRINGTIASIKRIFSFCLPLRRFEKRHKMNNVCDVAFSKFTK